MEERNSGIDFLRIISMVMIVTLHVLLHGGILDHASRFSLNYELAWFLETASFCAVNCYALISGYVGVDSKFQYSNIFYLWLQTVFYRVLITGIFLAFGTVGISDFMKSFFPILFPQHWYFTAYFGMFFFIPYYNHLLNSLPQKQLKHFLLAIFILFSILPTIRRADCFGAAEGYSMLWISLLYIIGGYLKKYNVSKNIPSLNAMLIYISCIFFTWFSKLFIEVAGEVLLKRHQAGVFLITYTSPTILIASIALLLCFSNLRTPPLTQKLISFFAPLSFSVYLIHIHPLIAKHFLSGRFASLTQLSSMKFLFSILFAVMEIYFICCFIDRIRLFLFNKLNVKNKCQSLEQHIKKAFAKITFFQHF